jgi:hypothetical protein
MKRSILVLAVTLLPAAAADVAGSWRLTGNIAGVAIDRACTIHQTENKIEGPCKNQVGEVVLHGEVDGKSVTWKYEAPYEGIKMMLVFRGTLESNSEIKGTIADADNTVTGSFSAKRQ